MSKKHYLEDEPRYTYSINNPDVSNQHIYFTACGLKIEPIYGEKLEDDEVIDGFDVTIDQVRNEELVTCKNCKRVLK